MIKIDPKASVADGAVLGDNVEVGPFAVIGPDAKIGAGCKIGPHACILGHTTIGENTQVHVGAVIGDTPQDVHYTDELSYVDIGNNCIIREYVTIHRGTEEGSHTVVGNNVMLMAFSHLGHNCILADNVIVANASLLAGRVTVGERAFISGGCMVHQFVRIGRLAMIGGGNHITQDVPPFCLLQDEEIHGSNIVGLRRAGLENDAREALRSAIKIFFCYGQSRTDAVEQIKSEVTMAPEVQEFVDFVMSTKRGICPGHEIIHA